MNSWLAIDWSLFLASLIIILFSSVILVIIGSFSLQYLFYIFVGIFCFFLVTRVDYRVLKNFTPVLYLVSLIILIITFAFGESTRGVTRWLEFGSFSFQASEIVKPLLILSLADLGLKLNLGKFKNSFLFCLIFMPLFILVFKQPDLGNSLIYFIIFLSIFYTSRGNLLFLLFSFLTTVILSPLAWQFLKDYQKNRILSFFNPAAEPLGIGYNLIQAIITVGSGGFWGKGLGIGTQSTLKFLPEKTTDFIFAATAESVGFIGSFILLLAFFFLLLKILLSGLKSKDNFARNIIFGVFAMIFSQVMINIGMNLGLLPITGVTLPLVSQGGSSLVATMISLGLVSSTSDVQKSFPKLLK